MADLTLWIIWLIAVPLGPISGWMARTHWNKLNGIWHKIILTFCFLSIGVACCMLWTLWSLRGFWADAVNLALAYVALSVLCWLSYRNASKWLSLPGPILVSAGSLLLFLGVYTLLPFMGFAQGRIPTNEVSVGNHTIARTRQFGWTFTMGYNEITLIRAAPWFPIVEHVVYKRSFSDDECGPTHDVISVVLGNRVEIVCTEKPPITLDNILLP